MKWGFVGYGRIARKFEESLKHSNHTISAIASKSGFSNIPDNYRAYKDYADLFKDPEVEIVYINTTHNTHAKHTIHALENGKHVLCEKPMAVSADEVESMINSAEKNQRFLMEAIWSRYLPGYQKVMELIESGTIGEVQFISAHFGFRMNPDDPKERLIKPELAAGAVWDVGIYPISLAQDIFRSDPEDISVCAGLSQYGVEDRCSMQFVYSGRKVAQLSCAIDLNTINKALISGTKGTIEMEDFWRCENFKLSTDKGLERFNYPMVSNGLYHEAVACKEIIEQGLYQSPLISWQHSLQLAKIMDDVIEKSRGASNNR